MHPNASIIDGAAILRVKDALGSVTAEIVRLTVHIDVSHQNKQYENETLIR